MKGTRSLKTSALKLHEKMAQMSARIHELEDALASLQASVSAEPHPLLQGVDDEERSRSPIPVAALNETSVPVADSQDDLTEALGTLTIRPFGESQFHGETASSEYLFQVNSDQSILASSTDWDQNSRSSKLPPDLVLFSVLFPFPPSIMGEPVSSERFLQFLPEYREAIRISEYYFNHFSWCSLPISKEDLYETLNNDIYIDGRHPSSLPRIGLHRLSLVLMVFALGCLFDVNKPVCPPDAEDFHSLARAALCGEQIFNIIDGMVYENVRPTLYLLPSFVAMLSIGLGVRVAEAQGTCGRFLDCYPNLYKHLQIGLHREPTSKSFQPCEVLRRQTTFWDGDVWQSFVYGRPSSMVFSQIDCKKPREVGGSVGAPNGLFYRWKYGFTNLVGDVLSLTTGATATNYRGICELERKIREYPVPPELQFPEASAASLFTEEHITQTLQRFVIMLWQHSSIMYIHRRFLVQAIRMNPDSPTDTHYGQSVHAAYDSASETRLADASILESFVLCFGALVARSPSCIYSNDAMCHLEDALRVFSEAEGNTVQPPNSAEVLANLHQKAAYALARRESYRDPDNQISDEYVGLGALGQVLEPSVHTNGSPSSPHSHSPDRRTSMYIPMGSHHRGLPSSSPTDSYHPTSRRATMEAHQQYADEWIQQQAYFPPKPGSDNQDHVDTPSSTGTGYDVNHSMEGQAEWQHGFMQSMGV
ncbi:hypothetical protein BU17DRAFT_91337 [Hysterangium stoloniferum]|nr:hypothetical protein BU17DRAFT_91337 [Hysterangium stoloniferum]